jgi:hypothetical protein
MSQPTGLATADNGEEPEIVQLLRGRPLPPLGLSEAIRMFTADPGQVVRSTPFNSSARHWSPRYLLGLQGGSRHAYGFLLVQDVFEPDVEALVDEPAILIKYTHIAPDGHKIPITLKPDCALLRRPKSPDDTGVVAADVMSRDELKEQHRKDPTRYFQGPDGRWHDPGAEAWAAERGFTYELWCEDQLDPILVTNAEALVNVAYAEQPPQADIDAVVARVQRDGWGLLGDLDRDGLSVRAAKWLIARGIVGSNLRRHSLASPDHFPVYASQAMADALDDSVPASWAIGGDGPRMLDLAPGVRLEWEGRPLKVLAVAGDSVLAEIEGTTSTFQRDALVSMWRQGTLTGPPVRPLREVATSMALERYRAGGAEGIKVALWRIETLRAFTAASRDPAHPWWSTDKEGKRRFRGVRLSTLATWERGRFLWEAQTGDRLVGLVQRRNPGNRTSKLTADQEAVIAGVAGELWGTAQKQRVKAICLEVAARCERKAIPAPHPRTIRQRLRRLPLYETTLTRDGAGPAYPHKPHDPVDPDSSSPTGIYPNQVLFIDHTVVDDETVDPESGEAAGRLKLSRGVDGASGRECAHRFTYRAIDGITVLLVLLEYIRRTGRIPERLVLDLDPAHRSIELLAFCEVYGIDVLWHRTRQARDSWAVERGFRTANDLLFHALRGNTQVMKAVREVGRDNDPRRLAVHTLLSLDALYRRAVDALNASFRRIIGVTPDDFWHDGLRAHGVGREAVVDDRMRFLALAIVSGTTREVRGKDGVTVGYLRYEHPAFEGPAFAPLAGKRPRWVRAEVRVDPDDISRVVVLKDGVAYVAVCKAIARLRVISREELTFLTERIKHDMTRTESMRRDFERKLAQILADARAWENEQVALRARIEREARQGAELPPTAPPSADAEPEVDVVPSYWDHVWDDLDAAS